MSGEIFYYNAISIDCIVPDLFPPVALFLRTTGNNHVLYKSRENAFTHSDFCRLKRNGTSFLYIRNDEEDTVNAFMEANLAFILEQEEMAPEEKEKVLYRTTINYICDVFKNPETICDYERSSQLMGMLVQHISRHDHILKTLQLMAGEKFYIFTHSMQVTALTMYMHDKLYELSHDELVDVGLGAMLHDIGVVLINPDVISDPEALSSMEPKAYYQHAEKGYQFLKGQGIIGEMPLNIVRYHHERHDGTGYPHGLEGELIPRSAQLAAICNMYCNLTTDRPHRKASSSKQALLIMKDKLHYFNRWMFEGLEEILALEQESAEMH